MKSYIIVKNQAEFIHRYKNAPNEVAFLRDYHRHTAYIETEIEVYHDDRELEFIMVKDEIDRFLRDEVDLYNVDKSCEMLAKEIIAHILETYGERALICKVFEDNENGAKVVYSKE